MSALRWVKSSYSDDSGGACVEIAFRPGEVRVRDSKNPCGPSLAFPAEEWSAFLLHVLHNKPAQPSI